MGRWRQRPAVRWRRYLTARRRGRVRGSSCCTGAVRGRQWCSALPGGAGWAAPAWPAPRRRGSKRRRRAASAPASSTVAAVTQRQSLLRRRQRLHLARAGAVLAASSLRCAVLRCAALQNGQQLPLLAAALPRALCCADSPVAPPCCAARAHVHHLTCVPLLAGCLPAALAAGHQGRCQALATTRTAWASTTASSRSTAHAWVSVLRTLRHSMLRCASPALRPDANRAVHWNRQGSRSSSGSWLGWCCSKQAVGGDQGAPV